MSIKRKSKRMKDIESAAPASGGIDWKEYERKLLVIEPLELETGIKTKFSKPGETSDAVRADVYVLTGPGQYEEIADTLIFPRVLIGQLKKKIDKVVVGRLTKGEAKSGQSAPWVLAEATEKDLARAREFYTTKSVTAAVKPAVEDDEEFADGADEEVY